MPVYDVLKKLIVERLNLEPSSIKENASFLEDLGADSLEVVELIIAIEEEYGIEIPDEDIEKIITVGDAVEYIKNKTGKD